MGPVTAVAAAAVIGADDVAVDETPDEDDADAEAMIG